MFDKQINPIRIMSVFWILFGAIEIFAGYIGHTSDIKPDLIFYLSSLVVGCLLLIGGILGILNIILRLFYYFVVIYGTTIYSLCVIFGGCSINLLIIFLFLGVPLIGILASKK